MLLIQKFVQIFFCFRTSHGDCNDVVCRLQSISSETISTGTEKAFDEIGIDLFYKVLIVGILLFFDDFICLY